VAEIEWTAEAERRLRRIYDYIAQDKPEAALRLVEAIYKRTEILRDFPESGHRYSKRPHENVRILLYGHYRIPYQITSSGDIRILGVFHGAMEMPRYLE
jgi:plasmid stabilization system protein ParE